MKGFFHDKVKIFGQELKNKTKKIVPSFMCLAVLISSAFSFMASAASSVIVGSVEEVGEGEKSPTNPYDLIGVTEGLPNSVGALYGDGVVNDTYNPSTGKVVRYWHRLVLDSSVHMNMAQAPNQEGYTAVWIQSDVSFTGDYSTNLYSSHFKVCNATDLWYNGDLVGIALNNQRLQLRFPKTIATDLNGFYQWLDEQKSAGTPVTVIVPIVEVVEDYVNTERIQYIHLTGSSFAVGPPGSSTGATLEGDTLSLPELTSSNMFMQFSLISSEYGHFFKMNQGIKYTIDLKLLVDSLGLPYQEIGEAEVFLTLQNSDGSESRSVVALAYIDGLNLRFQLEITPDVALYCTRMNFHISGYYYTKSTITLHDSFVSMPIEPDTPLYPPPNTGDLDNMEGLEGQVNNQNQQGMDNAAGYQDSALTTIVKYVAGFQAVAAIIGKIGDIPFIGALLTLSVSIGLFAFLLGMVGSVYRSRNQGDAQVKRDPSTTIFTKWRGGK